MNQAQAEGSHVLTLAEIAELADGRLTGDPGLVFRGVASVEEARPDEIAFFTSRRYIRYVSDSRAGAFLISEDMEELVPEGVPRVTAPEPHRALIAVLRRLHPQDRGPAGVHPTAVLGRGVELEEDVGIGAYTVIEDGAVIGAGTRIGPHVVVGRNARVGASCTIYPQVVLYADTVLGDRVMVHSGTRLGSDGFGYAFFDGAHQKIPHVGGCTIEDDVEIGANTCVDRGSVGTTVIEAGCKVDNLIQVAHNVRLGSQSMVAALVGIAGSTQIGKGVWLGGQAGLINHLDIGDGARVAVAAKVMRDVAAGETISGHPARPHREDLRKQANLSRLPKLLERVKALEAEVDSLRSRLDP
ncbi:MAG: UDP-3-O-(3-hydroxymyristoyl)glucosamine N-acyltransferase [Gemmatimonadota bacterium]